METVSSSKPKNSRRFVWTLFKYNFDTDPVGDQLFTTLPDGVRFVIWQHEKCPTTGRDHLQGYLRLENSGKFGTVKKILKNNSAYVAAAKYPEHCSENYCSKEATHVAGPWQFGTPLQEGDKAGARLDLRSMLEMKKAGTFDPLNNTEHGALYVKHHSGLAALDALRAASEHTIRDDVKVMVIVGQTAIGKTQFVYDAESIMFPSAPWPYEVKFPKASHAQFYIGYQDQLAILLDDFKDTQVDLHYLLRVLDKFPFSVRTGTTLMLPAKWRRVYILSNIPPDQWYLWEDGPSRAALMRRISLTYSCTTREELKDVWTNQIGLPPHPRWSTQVLETQIPAGLTGTGSDLQQDPMDGPTQPDGHVLAGDSQDCPLVLDD
nr:MAG: replication associated protein [Arizlama virus]